DLTMEGMVDGSTAPTFSGSPPFPYSSVINIYTTSGVPNTSGWWGNIDLTSIQPAWNSNGTLITQRDLLMARHTLTGKYADAHDHIGDPIDFVNASGAVFQY